MYRVEDVKYKITKEKMPTKSGKLKVKGIGESVREAAFESVMLFISLGF